MIKNFFHALEQAHIQYLLINGQATVLYGAATFSEDIDLWVCPEEENWRNFISVLQEVGTKTYKATPPLSLSWVNQGHGFHFEFPETDKEPVWFLDVMGVVPRVRHFNEVQKNRTLQESEWGKIPVIGPRELVEVKKTRRLEDYAVISNLVNAEFDKLCMRTINTYDWEWILTNSFDAEDIVSFLTQYEKARTVAKKISRPCLPDCLKAVCNEDVFFQASKKISMEIEKLRMADRIYWRPVIAALQKLHHQGRLMPPGSVPVWTSE